MVHNDAIQPARVGNIINMEQINKVEMNFGLCGKGRLLKSNFLPVNIHDYKQSFSFGLKLECH